MSQSTHPAEHKQVLRMLLELSQRLAELERALGLGAPVEDTGPKDWDGQEPLF